MMAFLISFVFRFFQRKGSWQG
ncbi:ATP synthase subunit 9 mitochondrial [Bienertia sinuspersici]